ncbi:MAG: hypothetical protein ACI8V5_000263, partial [Limisphaerales bacterium]
AAKGAVMSAARARNGRNAEMRFMGGGVWGDCVWRAMGKQTWDTEDGVRLRLGLEWDTEDGVRLTGRLEY